MSFAPFNPSAISQLTEIPWSAVAAPGAIQWKKVVWVGQGIFVAIGTNAIIRSTDYGATWGALASPANKTWNAMASNGNGVLVAAAHGGSGNIIMRSTDYGATWTQPDPSVTSTVLFNNIVYNNGKFIAVGEPGPSDNNNLMTSLDLGLTWSYGIVGSSADRTYLEDIHFARNIYVTCGRNDAGSVVWTSPDAATWTRRITPGDFAPSFNSVTWGTTGGWVIVGDFGDPFAGTLSSPDAIVWTIHAPGYETIRSSMVYVKGLYVAVSNDGLDAHCLATTDGQNWHYVNTPEDNGWTSIAASDTGVLVAVALTGTNRIMRAIVAPQVLQSASLIVANTSIVGPTAIQPLVDQHLNAPVKANLLYCVKIDIDFTADALGGIKISLDDGNLSAPLFLSCHLMIIDNTAKNIALATRLTDYTMTASVVGPTDGHVQVRGLLKSSMAGIFAPLIKPSNDGFGPTTIQSAFMSVFPATG
jgi:hypothetical protein